MRAEDLLTQEPSAEAVAAETARLPAAPEATLDEVRRLLEVSERAPSSPEWPPVLQAPRNKKDTRYADPPSSHRPVVGPVLVTAKRAFRLAFQPFINEIMRRQVEFNEAILESLAVIYEHQQESSRTQALWRQEMERRLARLEAERGVADAKPSDDKPRASRKAKKPKGGAR
ncbi:hypothetical protein [Archangium lipolyticum]|uniref:hypothetical protein n=1 Tax=Archangium lipolyticum TaxID=2970465 RepID=UPI00214A3299|nr:hypothetical protein [Archangium lipolyticum]